MADRLFVVVQPRSSAETDSELVQETLEEARAKLAAVVADYELRWQKAAEHDVGDERVQNRRVLLGVHDRDDQEVREHVEHREEVDVAVRLG